MPGWTTSTAPTWKFLSAKGYNKRRVIATDQGWVHRNRYTDTHGVSRTRDECLVSIPELGTSTANVKDHAWPKVVEIYTANTTGGTILKRGRVNHLYLVFDEPLTLANNYGRVRVTIANTAAGNNVVATSNNLSSSVTNGDNTLVFNWKSTANGTFKVQTQSIANSATWDSLTGTASQKSASNTVTGVGTTTKFTTELKVGDIIKYTTNGTVTRVVSISTANTMVVNPRPSANVVSNAMTVKRVFTVISQNSRGEAANLYITSAVSNAYSTFKVY